MSLNLNIKIYSVFFCLIIPLFINCTSTKHGFVSEPKIIEVTSQKYSGGLKGSPSGIKYKIYLISPGNYNDFQTLGFWVDDKYAVAKGYKKKLGVQRNIYEIGDTLEVSANFIKTEQGLVFQDNQHQKNKPSHLSQKIVLEYAYKNQNKFIGFDQIKILEMELRP